MRDRRRAADKSQRRRKGRGDAFFSRRPTAMERRGQRKGKRGRRVERKSPEKGKVRP